MKDAATSRDESFTDVEVKLTAANADGWTEEQNKFLVQALEAVPKDAKMKESERWKKVAACVPGKDAKQCFERYKSCLLYTSPSPRDATLSRMPSSA